MSGAPGAPGVPAMPVPRSDDLVERLASCYSGAVHDVLRERGRTATTLPADLVPLVPGTRVAGPAFTVEGALAEVDAHDSLVAWTRMLSAAPAGSVVVCQPNDRTIAHMGELSAETLQQRGVRGFVVDGGCRDTDFVRSIGFPVFCAYTTPVDVVGRWRVDRLGGPIRIGDVAVRTGDLVLADSDGVVVIPHELAEEVVEAAVVRMGEESGLRRAIRAGQDPHEAYLEHGVF